MDFDFPNLIGALSDEERITFGQNLGAEVGIPGTPHDLPVPLEERRPAGPECLGKARRALDVGEQERDGSSRELGHAGKYAGRWQWRAREWPAVDSGRSATLRR